MDARDFAVSCFLLLGGFDPADPFVTRERREIDPSCERVGVTDQKFAQVFRQLMHDACRNGFLHQLSHLDSALRSLLRPQSYADISANALAQPPRVFANSRFGALHVGDTRPIGRQRTRIAL